MTIAPTAGRIEDLLRTLAPQVLGALTRRYGNFDLAEDAVQEALIAASQQWPEQGTPDNPRAWLITVAARRLTDLLRSRQARQRREDKVARWTVPDHWRTPAADEDAQSDDSLILLLLCCHPSLSPTSQIALTMRAVGGLTTAEIARAFLVPEPTMTRRITRAKQQIRDSGIPFGLPPVENRGERLGAVLHTLYLIFNEGYAATSGPSLYRADLSAEAIRLTRIVHHALPDDGEVTGLLSLMLLTDARRPARLGRDGALIPMADQDRTAWDTDAIAEGVALITKTLPVGPTGPYQLQAAIAAVHDEARRAEETDWPQIVKLYEVLMDLSNNPMMALNHAVAVSMVDGPRSGLALVDALGDDERISRDHRFHAVRAHLLDMAGEREAARMCFEEAAAGAMSFPVRRYLNSMAAALRPGR